MIGVDWGTSAFRAFRLAPDGRLTDTLVTGTGIMQVTPGGFADALFELIGPWLADGEDRVVMSGMVGSRQGWQEARYLPCPANLAAVAHALVTVPFAHAQVRLIPGLSDHDDAGVPEVMRGEETQLFGVMPGLASTSLVCLPGSHSKWAHIENGRIVSFRTYMTGEVYAALRSDTILGRMMTDAPIDEIAFARGVRRSGNVGHLLHQLFGVRTLGLFGRLSDDAAASNLSGLLIGHEVRAAMPASATVHLIGAGPLCRLYALAIEVCGGLAVIGDEQAAARGLAIIGQKAKWS